MSLKVDASFENGVFVPSTRPVLADRERVRLTIERQSRDSGRSEAHPAGSLRKDGDLTVDLDYHPDGC
jgi:Protein of unknown function DUF104